MTFNLFRAHFPVLSLGYGRRVGIWFQGCPIGCAGCIVPESWEASTEHCVDLISFFEMIRPWLDDCDGVTLSGGEPFAQPAALETLIDAIRGRCAGDIIVYSGYSAAYLRRTFPTVFSKADALITGPFKKDLPDERPFVGSSNQELILHTPLARERYENLDRYERQLNFAAIDGEILFAGVPRRRELAQLISGLRDHGVYAEATHEPV